MKINEFLISNKSRTEMYILKTSVSKKEAKRGLGKGYEIIECQDLVKEQKKAPKGLNLGCGDRLSRDCINVDSKKFDGVDLVWDLNKFPYPFKDNQFEEIFAFNILEHLNDPHKVMEEIYRIVKPDGIVNLQVPHFSSNSVWGDIQHKRGFSYETFKNKNISKMFRLVKQRITFSRYRFIMRKIANQHPRFYEKVLAYIFNASGLDVVLKAGAGE